MASNGSCFMVTCTIIKNHLLEVGLTQNYNWETMVLQTLTIVKIIPFYHGLGPHMNRNSLKHHLVEGTVTYDFTLTLEGP